MVLQRSGMLKLDQQNSKLPSMVTKFNLLHGTGMEALLPHLAKTNKSV